MENYLNENFRVPPKNPSNEALQRWRNVCGVVKNPKRRFRFTANLSRRFEAAAIRRCNQEKLTIAVLVSKAAFQFISGEASLDYTVPEEVSTAGFQICADELQSIVEQQNTRKLRCHGGVSGIVEKLSTSTTGGLTTDNFLLNRRQEIYGTNSYAEKKAWSFWVLVWEALQDVTLIIDLVCGTVSSIVHISTEGWQKGANAAIVMVASISLAVFVTAIIDYWQSLQFWDLDKEKQKLVVQVTRDGLRQKVLASDLLPGDIVHLASGDRVPADGLFVSGFSTVVNQSSLTGNSEPLSVNTERPFLLSGAKVQDGSCKMMVTTVGMRTYWGKSIAPFRRGEDDETPLQVKLNGVAAIIGKLGLLIGLVISSVLVQQLIIREVEGGSSWSLLRYYAWEMFEYLTIAFTIFVVVLPEGLPLAMTVNLSFAMKKLRNNRALICHRAACETMGSVTEICTHKTGILTTNHMTVVKSCICLKVREVSKHASSLYSDIPYFALKLLLQSIFNNTSGEVALNKDGKPEILGTPIESALLEFGLSLGGDFQSERQAAKLVQVKPFDSSKKWMSVVLQLPDGGLRAHCKGASEMILAFCDKVIDSNGMAVPLDEAYVNHLKVTINQFANEALQTLCLAYMELEDGFPSENHIPTSGYTCIGIVGIKSPIRPGVKESIEVCRSAGITVRMVTDDNLNTAKAIARECGILTDDGIAIEGPVFRGKSQQELLELIPRIQVMAQSSSVDKHMLVKQLQTTFNQVVAVTGDGADDVPSLRNADIGLVTDISGTEVAKESADVRILDDSFTTIMTVAHWGRSTIMNVKKYVQFRLTVSLVAFLLVMLSACLIGNPPFSEVELVWIGLTIETMGAFALAAEPLDIDLMKRPPLGSRGSLITNVMWRNIFGQACYQFAIIWFLQVNGKAILHLDGPDSDVILQTFIFNSFIFCQVSSMISSRKMEKINVFNGILDNHVLAAVLCCIVILQIAIIEFLGPLANTLSLNSSQWLISVLIGLSGIPVAAVIKMIPVGSID